MVAPYVRRGRGTAITTRHDQCAEWPSADPFSKIRSKSTPEPSDGVRVTHGEASSGDESAPHGRPTRHDLGSWYAALLDHTGDALVVAEAVRTEGMISDWRIVAANDGAQGWWAAGSPELTGRLVSELAPVLEAVQFPSLWAHAVEVGHLVETYTELRLADGTPRRPIRIAPVGHDTVAFTAPAPATISRKACTPHPALPVDDAAAVDLLRTILDHSADLVLMMDATATITWISESAERLSGFTPDDLIGSDALAFVHPDDVGAVTQHIVDALEPGSSPDDPVTVRILDCNGSVHWLEAVGWNHLEEPTIRQIVVHLRDVTEQHEMTAQLRASEARIRGIFDSAVDGIVTVDPDGFVESFNRGAEDIFGWSANEIVGKRCDLLFGPGNLEQLSRTSANETGPHRLVPGYGVRKNGARFPAQVSLSRFHARTGDVTTAIVRDVSEQRTAEARLRLMALNDPLTGLPNRREMTARIEAALDRAQATGAFVAVLYVDLDRFKIVNDTLGHEVGDQLLVLAGARISSMLRAGDAIARLGGDEFVVLCERLGSADEAVEIAGRVRDALTHPFELAGHFLFVSGSIGVTVCDTAQCIDATPTAVDLIRQADTALYRAKDEGPGHVVAFDHSMHRSVAERLEQESALRNAIEHGELRAHFQPVVSLATGRIEKFEALARWERPGHGLVPPAEFIPVAEDSGLIVEVGEFMLREAASDCARWQSIAPGVGVTVNVSAYQFAQSDLAATVLETLSKVGLDPHLLTIEITESAMSRDPEQAIVALETMRSVGVRIALDDFGTGYSSLTQLRTLPIDTLKIDKSFVDILDESDGDASIVQAIIDLGRARGLEIIAEGVATQAIALRLRLLGCEHAQGYLYSFPVPIAQTLRLLAAPPSATGTDG